MKRRAKLTICNIGCVLLQIFAVSTLIAGAFWILGACGLLPFAGGFLSNPGRWLLTLLIIVLVENVIFWPGMIMVYTSSSQLGIKRRALGIAVGLIPIVNLIMLFKIISVTRKEVRFEQEKDRKNDLRKKDRVCETKYPLLLVHGVFFRDFDHFNYWGRIPEELQKNGAVIYYGNHNSAAAIDDSAKELEARILEIVRETGCEKVNVIAHSKGGLDTRTAIAQTEAGKYIASLTTINTPHRGCEFADYLLNKIPKKEQEMIAHAYNTAAAKLGDTDPDFLAAVYDLTSSHCAERNKVVFDDPNIYYQSVGSALSGAASGQFPLNMTYKLVKHFDGPNDGLVGEGSFAWGSDYRFLTIKGKRGISHGDVIDLNRENIDGFDVREFFVELVQDLKNKGF